PITVTASDFDRERIPAHLRMTFRVVDGKKTVGLGEDLAALTTQAKPQVRKARKKQAAFAPTTGLTGWTFGSLDAPEQATAGVVPGLDDRSRSVRLVAVSTAGGARLATRQGIITLLSLHAGEALKYLQDGLTTEEKLILAGHQKSTDALLTALIRVGIRGL